MNANDIQLLSVPANVTAYAGAAINLVVQATSQGGYSVGHRWYKNGVEMMGQTSNVFTIASAVAADGGTYAVVLTTPVDSKTLSVTVTISPTPVLTITTQPQHLTLIEGVAGQLSVVASVLPMQLLSYQWYKDGSAVAGGVSATLAIAAAGPGRAGQYYVEVKTTQGPLQTAKSNTVKVTANQSFNVASSTGCVNGYCNCVTGGQLYVPYQPSAAAICVFKGYADVTTFTTQNGPVGSPQCSAGGGGCYINQNPGNIICSVVNCTK